MSLLPEELFPTPKPLVDRMVGLADMDIVTEVLEPSAGTGNIVKGILDYAKYSRYDTKPPRIDVCEIEKSLHPHLKELDCHVVGEDFLRFNTFKHYDLIIMNPPFSEGDKHLLKALDMIKYGGQVVCILNAETLKNPYSVIRKDLVYRLEKLNAKIKYIEDAFTCSERNTDVEIALIYVKVENCFESSDLLDNLKAAEAVEEKPIDEETQVSATVEEYIKGIVKQFEFECKAGLKLIAEFNHISKKFLGSFIEEDRSEPILKLSVAKVKSDAPYSSVANAYLEKVRYKYWEALFKRPELQQALTTTLAEELIDKLYDLRNYDFNLSNIYQLRIELNNRMLQGVEDEIMNMFNDFAHEYSWYPECRRNIVHYYNGWATNKCGIINKKVIIPTQAYDYYRSYCSYSPNNYKIIRYIADIEKAFNYLGGNADEDYVTVSRILDTARETGQTKDIDFKYFKVTFYKKGTCHISFKDMGLLKKLNIFAGRKLNALPPSYGKKAYSDMTERERAIIDDFEGEEAYAETMENPEYYLVDVSKTLMLEQLYE